MKENFWQLTLITNKGNIPIESYLQFVEICIKAGITCIQLREKTLSTQELLHFGNSLKQLTDLYNLPLIINDNIDLCLQLKAAGVHLGQSDLEINTARSMLGSNKIIGLSVNNIEQIQSAAALAIDYIGVGAIFPTLNKPDIETVWGIDGLRQASQTTSHPIVAIGGINESNANTVMDAGASGIAAIGALHHAKDPFSATQNLIKIINEAKNDR